MKMETGIPADVLAERIAKALWSKGLVCPELDPRPEIRSVLSQIEIVMEARGAMISLTLTMPGEQTDRARCDLGWIIK